MKTKILNFFSYKKLFSLFKYGPIYNKNSLIEVKISDTDYVEEITENIENVLYGSRLVNEETQDFTITSSTNMIETLTSTMATLSFFLIGIAAISLIVGAIGISNTMFMSVKERTYEIGVLRAIGTSRRHVFFIFLEESLLLGVVGTIIGIFAGLALANLFALMLEQVFGDFQGFKITGLPLTQDSVIIGLIGGLLAVVSGAVYPAVSASRVNVLQALRPEMRVKRKIPDSILLIAGLLLFFFNNKQVL